MVSVIVPVLNAEEHLEHQLTALTEQTYGGRWEVVIVDNGCTDRSMEIASSFEDRLPSLRIADASARRGINRARNAGAAAARGDFLAYCDADDVATPGWLEAIARAATNADLVGGAFDHDALNGPIARSLYPWDPPAGLLSGYGFLPYVSGGNCGVWADVARAVRWDEDFTFGSSDIEFSWRAQLASYRVHFAADAVIQLRFKTSLLALARQYYAYGRSDPKLDRHFRDLGMGGRDENLVGGSWRLLARRLPELAGPLELRARWVRLASRKAGRMVGVIREGRSGATRPSPDDDRSTASASASASGRPRGLRLLEVGLHWPPETFLQLKFERLAARGIDVTVASTVPRHKANGQVPGVRLQRVPSWAEPRELRGIGTLWDGLSLLVRDPSRLRTLVAAVRRPRPPSTERTPWPETVGLLRQFLRLAHLHPDVVHFEWPTAAVHHIALADVWDVPVVMSCRASLDEFAHSPVSGRWSAGLPLAFARASAVHCVCEAVQEKGIRYGLDPQKAWLIRPAVDPEFFHPPATAREGVGPLRVVVVARFFWTKGHEYALQAVRLLLDRGIAVHLDLIGDGPERDRIAGTIDDLELGGQVEVHARVAPSGIRGHLHGADVLLQPSMVEGIANTVLEAMACALPVVVTDCDGMREAVTDGREGFMVPPRDPPAMAHSLEALAQDATLRRRMGAAGRARVLSEFSIDTQVERTVAMYESVAARHAEAAR